MSPKNRAIQLEVGVELVFDELGQTRDAAGVVHFGGKGLVVLPH